MKIKYILVIVVLILFVAIVYLYKKGKASNEEISFMAELDVKQKQLDLFTEQLCAAKFQKAYLDKIAAKKTSLLVCILLIFSLTCWMFTSFYGITAYSNQYIVPSWYALTIISVFCSQKPLSWNAIIDWIGMWIRHREYRYHGFNPDSINTLTVRTMKIKEEIAELKVTRHLMAKIVQ